MCDNRGMTPNQQMEQFSLAYVRAVAVSAGYQVTRPETDDDSVDGIMMARSGHRARIEFQAKATSRELLRSDGIHFPLPVKNYDDLRVDTLVPRILVMLLLPNDNGDWVTQSDKELCLRYCAYWLSLVGMLPTPNSSSVMVAIPTSNVFNRAQLDDLMNKAVMGRP